jgi:ABC-type branched-subunit amino acid transport system ATPase component
MRSELPVPPLAPQPVNFARDLAHCFLRLANLMILMDEPSMGLSPLPVKEVFAINRDLGVTILLVEQNARAALSVASHG